ncbi:MAG TPA: DUF2155 domain-containing protein [Rhizomicrobium sp.]|nr:DUF2155 domain-containing protein [Rhizomicrobium sp.]
MKRITVLSASAVILAFAAAGAQTDSGPSVIVPMTAPPAAAAGAAATPPAQAAPPQVLPAAPSGPPEYAVLELKALDKITGKASVIMAPLNEPVKFATLTITARTCYTTPPSEPPDTSAFLQIIDHRPDQPERRVFSGWMYASSPGLNSLQHPLYDVWVITCMTSEPGQKPPVVATAPVRPVSPNAGANEAMPTLPEDAGQ